MKNISQDINKPVHQILVAITLANNKERGQNISILHLSCMTSDYQFSHALVL